MSNFEKEELIEIEGKYIEKRFAFPDLEGNQNAFMVKWDGKKWTLCGWGSCIDDSGLVACGWEPFQEGNRENVSFVLLEIMKDIEEENF